MKCFFDHKFLRTRKSKINSGIIKVIHDEVCVDIKFKILGFTIISLVIRDNYFPQQTDCHPSAVLIKKNYY